MVGGTMPAGCGRCEPCRVRRKSLWSSRIWLESQLHKENAFATLTYSEDKLPEGSTLNPWHLTEFLKSIRHKIYPKKIRYFAVGEYGTRTLRPHVHAVLFGYPECERGTTDLRLSRCCSSCDMVMESWGNGAVQLGQVNERSSAYIAKYVLKGLTKKGDPRLNGKYPEFTRMSLRPGIGAGAMAIFKSVLQELGANPAVQEQDVPYSFRRGMSNMPLGRYLRGKLREQLGRESKTPEKQIKAYWQEMSWLRKCLAQTTEGKKAGSFAKAVVDLNKQQWLNMRSRIKIRTYAQAL